jgi:hypothetical protein
MRYKYMMVQIDPVLMFKKPAATDLEGGPADYLFKLVSSCAQDGWEFYRVDPFETTEKPGCFGFLIGHRTIEHDIYIVTFRKEIIVPLPR